VEALNEAQLRRRATSKTYNETLRHAFQPGPWTLTASQDARQEHATTSMTESIVPLPFDTLSATLATRLRETQTSPIRWFKMLQAGATFSF
jgi:hypothetical protein